MTTRHRVRRCVAGPGIRGTCPDASRGAALPAPHAPGRPGPIGRDLSRPAPTARPVGGTARPGATAGLIYLAVAGGPCARMVVGWGIRDGMGAGLVASAPETACSRGCVAGGAMSHGDRGSQRASAGPAAWAAAHDAGPSVGRAGGCHGNAAAGPLLGTPRSGRCRHERLPDASTTRHEATESMGSCHDRLRSHGPIGDRVPADAMGGSSGASRGPSHATRR